MLDYLVIIQARLGSTRFPNKVLQMVGNRTMLRRVWDAAKKSMEGRNAKVIVAWPERYPDINENNVHQRFVRIANEFPSRTIIRLTSDCPLLEASDINRAIWLFNKSKYVYYSNHIDGKDVQIFIPYILDILSDDEHVISDFRTKRTKHGWRSVDTKEDLEWVRKLCRQ